MGEWNGTLEGGKADRVARTAQWRRRCNPRAGSPGPREIPSWDTDDVVVSTMNWGSQSGSPDNPLDEIGLHLQGADLAARLLAKFENDLEV